MILTLISLFFAGAWLFWPASLASNTLTYPLTQSIAYISAAFLIAFVLVRISIWMPLQKAEQNSTPRILELWMKDPVLKRLQWFFLAFPLISFAFIMLDAFQILPLQRILYAIWIVLFGIALDGLLYTLKKTLRYLNPFDAASLFAIDAKKALQSRDDGLLLGNIDALSEMGIKGLHRNSTSLSKEALNQMLDVAKAIINKAKRGSSLDIGAQDKTRFLLFSLFQPMENMNQIAVKQRLEPICNHIITTLGKISLATSEYSLPLATQPIYIIGKLAKSAVEHQMDEVGVKTTLLLQEIARQIVMERDLRNADLKDPMLGIINALEEIAKATFKKNKQTNIRLLIQPFKDLAALFKNERVASHPDTPVILGDIDRIIGEFEALESVLRQLPPIPSFSEEEQ